jgi:hypothetical protein
MPFSDCLWSSSNGVVSLTKEDIWKRISGEESKIKVEFDYIENYTMWKPKISQLSTGIR